MAVLTACLLVSASAFAVGRPPRGEWPGSLAASAPDRTLGASGLLGLRFGASFTAAERRVASLEHHGAKLRNTAKAMCGVDVAQWPGLSLEFVHGRLAGYGYGDGFGSSTPKHTALAGLTTARGLALGDSTRRAHTLYGRALTLSYAQAGSYVIDTRQGRIFGYLRPYRYGVEGLNEPQGTVLSIGAGDEGCPAESA